MTLRAIVFPASGVRVIGISRRSSAEPGQTGCTAFPAVNPLPVSGRYEKNTKVTADLDELDTRGRTCIIQQLNFESKWYSRNLKMTL
jgi:hypothetical protein